MPDPSVIAVVVQKDPRTGAMLVSAPFPGGGGGVVVRVPAGASKEQLADAVLDVAREVEEADVEALQAEGERQDAAERRGTN
jgi:hypothetical protein